MLSKDVKMVIACDKVVRFAKFTNTRNNARHIEVSL